MDTDVIVVGGGPTGMTAAGDLARLGRSVVVVERWPSINPASRAFATMARTLEVLDSRGLADGLLAGGGTTPAVNLFADARLDLTHLDTRFPYALITPQTNVDQALAGYAAGHGATITRGTEVVGLRQDEGGVTITVQAKDDPSTRRELTARYLVAADGAHSTVRRLLNLDFPGRAVLSSVVLADVELANGPAGPGLTLGNTADGFAFLAPYGNGWFRSMTWDRDHQVGDDEPVTDREIDAILTRSMGRDLGLARVSWKSRFHCDERQLARYRHGNVFFAGDAAHVHSPVGGQGMNTGIQDAANLAWKLDAALGGAADAVLDTYHDERHPIGRRVLRQSGLMMRAVILHPAPARWIRDRLAPAILGIPRVREAIAGSFAGTTLRYPGRDLVGTRATQVPLEGPRLTELQRDPGFVLIRGRDRQKAEAKGVRTAVRTDDGPTLLVRPDGYIAAVDDGWEAALAFWTGGTTIGSSIR